MKNKNGTGTEFTEATTSHGTNENGVPMMSERGNRLASISAPSSAFEVAEKTRLADAPHNPLQRALQDVFKKSVSTRRA
jgi:hypothetical protein